VIGALVIVFREVLEAGIIVGIALAATRGVLHRGWWIASGVLGGVLGAGIVAIFAGALSAAFASTGQELFNAAILATAVVMLTWHNVWMARHGREIAAEMRVVGAAVVSGSRSAVGLAIVVAVAVLREGVEVVLFLYGMVLSAGETGAEIFAGGIVGLLLGPRYLPSPISAFSRFRTGIFSA
jgi:high-affinity iron transporter